MSPSDTSVSTSAVMLYDGECGLCDRLVQWVLRRDRSARFHFAALQSAWGQAALRKHGLSTDKFDTMALVEGEKVYVRSEAVLRVLRGLPYWGWAYAFIVVPPAIRDAVYRWVARRRKKWFPAPAQCGLPKAGWRERFLE